jgi:hypothetical protein
LIYWGWSVGYLGERGAMSRPTSYGQSYDRLGPEMLPYCDDELADRKKGIKRSPRRKLIERPVENQ